MHDGCDYETRHDGFEICLICVVGLSLRSQQEGDRCPCSLGMCLQYVASCDRCVEKFPHMSVVGTRSSDHNAWKIFHMCGAWRHVVHA